MKKKSTVSVSEWYASGEPWVWSSAAAVAISAIAVIGLLLVLAINGLGHFWAKDVLLANYLEPRTGQISPLLGEIVNSEEVSREQLVSAGIDGLADSERQWFTRYLIKLGNRDVTGADFGWFIKEQIQAQQYPELAMTIERREWGNFYGFLETITESGKTIAVDEDQLWQELQQRIDRAQALVVKIKRLEKKDIGAINAGMERIRLAERGLDLKQLALTEERVEKETENIAKAFLSLKEQQSVLELEYKGLQENLSTIYQALNRDSITVTTVSGQSMTIPLAKIVRAYRPNSMSLLDKLVAYVDKVHEFLTDDPREANTEGGIYPAIFGTVMMVLLMSVMVTPFGVVAAVYLREYAPQGLVTRLIRIAVNNLAGVPSIVYGVFGLGFFIYFIGGTIDEIFFVEALPAPTFGTPGLLWASLTLALLTVPVVIVATEEGLSRIPISLREGSLALGATKAETLWRVVLPMASPAMMTGLILAVARAAGEVAPLMLVGVVKLAPSLPLDGNYPYLHLDQKFMHLGFHIYDVGFQSPNVEAARPLVYATAFLLVVVIALLNFSAVAVRNHLREKYKALEM